jgi:hypothetical protein
MSDRQKSATPSGEEKVRAVYEEMESRTASAFEDLVAKPSFGALLARSAENVAAATRIGSDMADLVLRNLRLAGRADVTRLARQLHRTEDKLERVLQELEELRDEVTGSGGRAARSGSGGGSSTRRGRSSNGGSSRSRSGAGR